MKKTNNAGLGLLTSVLSGELLNLKAAMEFDEREFEEIKLRDCSSCKLFRLILSKKMNMRTKTQERQRYNVRSKE